MRVDLRLQLTFCSALYHVLCVMFPANVHYAFSLCRVSIKDNGEFPSMLAVVLYSG